MIEKVWNENKCIELGKHHVARIEFYKHETGNIDIFKLFNENAEFIGLKGFIGKYSIRYKREKMEQLSLFGVTSQL